MYAWRIMKGSDWTTWMLLRAGRTESRMESVQDGWAKQDEISLQV